MKELPLIKPIIPSEIDPNNWTQFREWLNETFIEPLTKRFPAFELTGYAGTEVDDYSNGCHILTFNHPIGNGETFTEDDLMELDKICTQDDDSQPLSTYRFQFGTLWIFIPYWA